MHQPGPVSGYEFAISSLLLGRHGMQDIQTAAAGLVLGARTCVCLGGRTWGEAVENLKTKAVVAGAGPCRNCVWGRNGNAGTLDRG